MAKTTTQIALEYADSGWCVLPVTPNDKKPMLRSWERYINEKPNRELLRSWFDKLPAAGIGAVTGGISGIVVVDVDTRSGLDYRSITAKYPTGRIARTKSGGHHLYYRHPNYEVRNRVNIVEGVDVRGDGGFIVLPPSHGQYSWVEEGELGEYPQEFIEQDLLDNGQREQEKWVSELLRGVGQGSRNESAARLTGYFLNKAMPVDIVFSILREWNEKNEPPMSLKELETTIQSVFKKHRRGLGSKSTGGPEDSGPFDLVTMSNYFDFYGGEGVQWSIEDWLPQESIVFLVSPPESYKTWILLDLAVSIASGMPFLGEYEVNKTGPVIIIQQEDSHAGITERLSVIIQGKMDLHPVMGEEITMPVLPDLPIFLHPNRKLRFDDHRIMNELEAAIRQVRPVCVIIDPLYSATSADNYMAKAAEDMFRLKQFRDLYGCSFIVAHHSRKHTDPDSTAREDGWGSQFLNAFLETGWQVRRNPRLADNEVIVRRHSKTMGNFGMMLLNFDISTRYPMKYQVAASVYTPVGDRSYAQNQLYEIIMDGPATVSELAERTGKHKSTISRQLKQLETSNMVQRMPDGKFRVKEAEDAEI